MFKITMGKGFQMTFENGVTASVQWGPGNYCDARSFDFDAPLRAVRGKALASTTAEVAAWIGPNEAWITRDLIPDLEYDDVKGYLSVSEVMAFLNAAMNYKAE